MRLKRHRRELASRSRWLARIGQGLLLLLAAGYWSIQVVNGELYRDLADGNRLRKVSVSASRGLIVDRHGEALAENTPSYSLWLDRSRATDLDATVAFASDALEQDADGLRQQLAEVRRVPAFKPVALAVGLSLEQVARITAHQLEHPELEVRAEPVRLHRFAHQTAHVLGYLGQASEDDLSRGSYSPGDLVGKKGVERAYESVLRGRSGERVIEVDSRGRITGDGDSGGAPARSGHDLRLTLDLRLQQEAARLLEDKVGAIIALEPSTGEIRAMASSPGFDPNRFARGLDTTTWRNLIEHPDDPLQNRVIQNTYPPGSVFKIVMAVAALEAGHDPRHRVFCGGYSRVYGHRYRCWNRGGHGSVDLRGALKESCNVYFHHLGQRLDIDAIAEVARRFGFGRTTGIDIGGEKAGLVPTKAWSQRRRGMPWYAGETISVATGQGPLLVTPLQVANMMVAIANGGPMPRPHLTADALRGADPGPPRSARIAPSHLAFLRDALWAVVNEGGTGKSAKIDGFDIAGKTGTAQVVRQETWTDNDELAEHHRDHAWFASYGPVEDPQLAVVVFVEHGGGGSTAATPLAQAMYRRFLDLSSEPTQPQTPDFADGPETEPLRIRLADRAAP